MIGVAGASTTLGRAVLASLGAGGVAADLADLKGLDAVIAIEPGPAVVDAVVAAEVPYVDASSDPAWVTDVLQRYVDAPVPVVPACGFDGLVGDLAAAVAAEHYGGPVDEVVVHHDRDIALTGRPSRPRRVMFPNGPRWVVDTEFVELVLVPRHVPGARVATTLAAAPGVGRRLVGPLARRRTSFQVVAEAIGLGPRSYVVCDGDDVDAMAVRCLVRAARSVEVAGAMSPAEAFAAERFLDAVSDDTFRWTFEFPAPGDLS